MKEALNVSSGLMPPDPSIPPPRLCIETNSRFFGAAAPVVGVKLNGEVVSEVVEYQVGREVEGRPPINGWVRVGHRQASGRLARSNIKGEQFATTTLYGTVEPYFRVEVSRQMRRQLQRVGK